MFVPLDTQCYWLTPFKSEHRAASFLLNVLCRSGFKSRFPKVEVLQCISFFNGMCISPSFIMKLKAAYIGFFGSHPFKHQPEHSFSKMAAIHPIPDSECKDISVKIQVVGIRNICAFSFFQSIHLQTMLVPGSRQ